MHIYENHQQLMKIGAGTRKIDENGVSWVRKFEDRWRPAAACGNLLDSPKYRFLRFWRPPVLMDDECKIHGSGAGAWRLLNDEWTTDWKEFSHARRLEGPADI